MTRTEPILVKENYLFRFVQALLYLGGFRTESCKKVHIINYQIKSRIKQDTQDKTFISYKIHLAMHRRHNSQPTYTDTFKF